MYERGLFGDLLLPAIAVGVHKYILVFNTHEQTPHDPISVISPLDFGGYVNSQDPIVIAYNQVHFESLHPSSEVDLEKSRNLVKVYIEGEYSFTRADMQYLVDLEHEEVERIQDIQSEAKLNEESFQFLSNGQNIIITMDKDGIMQCPICLKKKFKGSNHT